MIKGNKGFIEPPDQIDDIHYEKVTINEHLTALQPKTCLINIAN
jgi:hypothetical protein